ncbi:MAG TPA: hypothetical protein VE967_05110 [Gemmatimonadaceae bacterium]|nr:hypothetical protein [Gemmatimonadaceae bacterium]
MHLRAHTVSLLLLVAACSGSTDPVANLATVTYKSAPFALNGTPAESPTAINTPTALTVRADVGYDFDVAFDLDPSGAPVIYTQRSIGFPLGSTGHQVALQILPTAFDAVKEAPAKNWIADSLLTVSVGQVIAVRSGTSSCQLQVSPFMYSKMIVDSVHVAQRQLFLTVVTDPNCGFRSLAEGRPTH